MRRRGERIDGSGYGEKGRMGGGLWKDRGLRRQGEREAGSGCGGRKKGRRRFIRGESRGVKGRGSRVSRLQRL